MTAFGLESNTWAATVYERRHQWADTFLRGNFFSGMWTSQYSEVMQAFLKSKINASVMLIDFVIAMDHVVGWL